MLLFEILRIFISMNQSSSLQNLYKPNPWFYTFQLGHIVALEILAYATVYLFGANVYTFLLAALFMGTSQTQGAWLNHDFGHLSVFKSTKLNYIFQELVLSGFQVILSDSAVIFGKPMIAQYQSFVIVFQ